MKNINWNANRSPNCEKMCYNNGYPILGTRLGPGSASAAGTAPALDGHSICNDWMVFMKIEVYASNTHVSKKDMDGKVVVAVDTLRAATTIITALHNGCAQIIPVEDVEKSKAELLDLIQDLTRHMRQQFTERFAQINQNFGQIFRELFGGGAAELSFTDDSDVLTSGIEIKVHPPGKIVTHIESLSGGEKALVAISIYFAIMRVNPPPFCVLDEIEAALDDVNVARFAQYLRRMSGNTQFITITHRRGTMEGSDMLYGVTMQDQGISKLLALRTEEAAEFGT